MTDAWPDSLPQCPILNAFSQQRQRNVASFIPEVGKPKMRRRSTAAVVLTQVAFRMNQDQVDTFNGFYIDTLADGTLPFEWDHPTTKDLHVWIFSGADAPQIERTAPDAFRVSFTLIDLENID